MIDPVAYILFCDMLCIRYDEESSVASHLHCLYSALKADGECPGFACIQEYLYQERTHQMDLRVMLRSLQTIFRLDNAGVASAILVSHFGHGTFFTDDCT